MKGVGGAVRFGQHTGGVGFGALAHDDQKAGLARVAAQVRPRPP